MEENKKVKGIRIRTFNTCMIVLCCIVYLFLIYATASMPSRYQTLIQDTDQYITCQKDAEQVYQASDYLTEQVRLYVENMNIRYMQNYFVEANETRRREKALEELKEFNSDERVQKALESALNSSNDLMEREIYAMKLVTTANDYGMDSVPEEVQNMQLTAADAALEPEEMIEKARDLVFNEGYQDAKALIYSHLSYFAENITENMRNQQEKSVKILGNTLDFQRILISILFVINILTFIVITKLIVKPLSIHIQHIKDNSALEIMGAYEFKYLALTYNDIYEINAANERMLVQKAEHDSLTGLLNRSAFEEIKNLLRKSSIPLALAVVDIDKFKTVNDENGHETGDEILKTVASQMRKSFRACDYVIRLGGDEFVILLTNITEDNRDVITRKFEDLNIALGQPENGLPAVSISVGVAFSECGFTGDLFEKADKSLYQAKNNGRSQCCFYKKAD